MDRIASTNRIFEPIMIKKSALLIGATGLVGEQCLQQLLANEQYDKVITLTRKVLVNKHPKHKNLVVDFDHLDWSAANIKADDVYCAFGTTIAKAGSQDAFRKIDVEWPRQIAQIAVKNGAQKFNLVSSIGADSQSSVFYSKMKGVLEDEINKMGYQSVIFFRPSILIGDRKEQRTGEAIGIALAKALSFLFIGPLRKYQGTPVDLLAAQMVKWGTSEKSGVIIVENQDILSNIC